MKIVTDNGQMDLPHDFSMTMERTNPFLSGKGDTSVPVTLPSSAKNLAALGHRERIDRAERYVNNVEAVLQVGPVQKRGRLVIDTAHRRKGIAASFAIDNSDLYVSGRGKTLKAILESWRGGRGMVEQFGSVAEAIPFMQACYEGTNSRDYTVFPVVVSPYETKTTVNDHEVVTRHYQYNNEIDGNGDLVWRARTVMEGDVVMSVPDGYGITPFLKLHRLIERVFQCLHYEVTENCFASGTLADLVMIHHCSDCLVTPVLRYADMAPSCTLSEFLEWLLAKFHAQPIVDSEAKTVRVVLMEDVLAGTADMDLSGMVEGDWTVEMNPTKRIVLTPRGMGEDDTAGVALATQQTGQGGEEEEDTLDSLTRPAAKTLNGLVKKYGSYVALNEDEWDTMEGQNATVQDRLVLRLATGEFYIAERNLMTGTQTMKRIGTNHFVYDRYNSSETEEHAQEDVMPLMTIGGKREVAPYIGERLHQHTSTGKAEAEEKQCLMVAWRAYNADRRYGWKTTGTTQSHVPYADGGFGHGDNLAFSLTNEGMYERFWSRWNTLLLNNMVRLKGRVRYSVGQMMGMDMGRLKLCGGRLLLPERASAQIGARMGLSEADFILAETYTDGVADEAIAPGSGNGLKWSVENDVEQTARQLYVDEIAQAGVTNYLSYDITLTETVTPSMPVYLNEVRTITVQATITVHYQEREIEQGQVHWINCSEVFANQTVTFTFTAVSV